MGVQLLGLVLLSGGLKLIVLRGTIKLGTCLSFRSSFEFMSL